MERAICTASTCPSCLVAASLRDRWTLHLGPSRQVLPGVLSRLGEIDVFLHDADHTYGSQMDEYRHAWRHLRPGAILLSDDVDNRAFFDFAREVDHRPWVVGTRSDRSGVAFLRKRQGAPA